MKQEKVCSGLDGNRENPVLLVLGEGAVKAGLARGQRKDGVSADEEAGRGQQEQPCTTPQRTGYIRSH